jgi:Uncharacterized conserved protein, contains double-stranded beta-helix domain
MIIGRNDGPEKAGPSGLRSATCTGDVWSDIVFNSGGARAISIFFPPGGRNHWHTHEGGQFVHVLSGEGWIQERGSERVTVRAGDMIWTEPGVEHWHGATDSSLTFQVAVHFGEVEWKEPVQDWEYQGSHDENNGG